MRRTRGETISLQAKVNKILLQYRIMQHTITKKSPAELFVGRVLRTRLDLIRPVKNREENKNLHNKDRIQVKFFSQKERVACRNYTSHEKWKFGKVLNRLGNLHYRILLDDGRVWFRHANQIRKIGNRIQSTKESKSEDDYYWEDKNENTPVDRRNITRPAVQEPRDTLPIIPAREENSQPTSQAPRRSNRIRHRPDYYVP